MEEKSLFTVSDVEKMTEFVTDSVEWLIQTDMGCCHYNLDDRLAIIIGWMPGYDAEDEGCIHSKDDPTYCINIGIGVHTSDYMLTDMEFINQPYYKNGEVWDTYCTLSSNFDPKAEINYLLIQYEAMSKLTIDEDGLITEEDTEGEV